METKGMYSILGAAQFEAAQLRTARSASKKEAAAKATLCEIKKADKAFLDKRMNKLTEAIKPVGKMDLFDYLHKSGLCEAYLEKEALVLIIAMIRDNQTMKWWLDQRIKHSPSRELRASWVAYLRKKITIVNKNGGKKQIPAFNRFAEIVRRYQDLFLRGELEGEFWSIIRGERLQEKQEKSKRLKAAGKAVNSWLGDGDICYTV